MSAVCGHWCARIETDNLDEAARAIGPGHESVGTWTTAGHFIRGSTGSPIPAGACPRCTDAHRATVVDFAEGRRCQVCGISRKLVDWSPPRRARRLPGRPDRPA